MRDSEGKTYQSSSGQLGALSFGFSRSLTSDQEAEVESAQT
jgi:hypothetical protein